MFCKWIIVYFLDLVNFQLVNFYNKLNVFIVGWCIYYIIDGFFFLSMGEYLGCFRICFVLYNNFLYIFLFMIFLKGVFFFYYRFIDKNVDVQRN